MATVERLSFYEQRASLIESAVARLAKLVFLRMFLWLSVVAAEVLRFDAASAAYVYTSLELEL